MSDSGIHDGHCMIRNSYFIPYLFPALCIVALSLAGPRSHPLLEGALFALLLISLLRGRGGTTPRAVPGTLALLLLSGLILLQMIPLEPALVRLLSPQIGRMYDDSIWMIDPSLAMPLSVRPKATLLEFYGLLSALAVYILALRLLREREHVRRAGYLLGWTLGAIAAFSLISAQVPILRETFRGGMAPNLLAMSLPLLLSFYLAVRPGTSHLSLRERLGGVLSHPAAHPDLLLAATIVLVAVAVLLTAEWGWLAGSLIGLLLMGIMFLRRDTRQRDTAIVLMFSFLLGIGGILLHAPTFEGKGFASLFSPPELSVEVFPLAVVGTGLGTMEEVRLGGAGESVANHAYQRMFVEGGWSVLIVALLFLTVLTVFTVRAWKKRRSRLSVHLAPGALAGMTVFLVSGFTEDVFLRGAPRLLFFFLAGVAVAAVRLPSRTAPPETPAEMPAWRPTWTAAVAALVLASHLIFHAGILSADYRAASSTGSAHSFRGAVQHDPLEDGYRFAEGSLLMDKGRLADAAESFAAAIRLAPLRGDYLQLYGKILLVEGENEKGGRFLATGLERGRATPERYRQYVEWLMEAGRNEEGIEQVRQLLFMQPEQTSRFLPFMSRYGIKDENLWRILPPRALAHIEYGDFLMSRGKVQAAEESFRNALFCLERERNPEPALLRRLLQHFNAPGRQEEALDVLRIGLRLFPENIDLRRTAIRLYEDMGLTVRAAEERRNLLLLEARQAEIRSGRLRYN